MSKKDLFYPQHFVHFCVSILLVISPVLCGITSGERPPVRPQFIGLPIDLEGLSLSKVDLKWSIGRVVTSSPESIEAGVRKGTVIIRVTLSADTPQQKKLIMIAPSCSVRQDGSPLKVNRTKLSKSFISKRYELQSDDQIGLDFLTDIGGSDSEPYLELTGWEFVVVVREQTTTLDIELPFYSGGDFDSQEPYLKLFIPPSPNANRNTVVDFDVDCGTGRVSTIRSSIDDKARTASSASKTTVNIDSRASVITVTTERRRTQGLFLYSGVLSFIFLLLISSWFFFWRNRSNHKVF